jgi:hypothetical protein
MVMPNGAATLPYGPLPIPSGFAIRRLIGWKRRRGIYSGRSDYFPTGPIHFSGQTEANGGKNTPAERHDQITLSYALLHRNKGRQVF